jgi:stromal membrane-associated protein
VTSPQHEMSSAFNLSNPSFQPKPVTASKPQMPAATAAAATMSAMDPWGGNAWGAPDPAPAPAPAPAAPAPASMMKIPDTLTPNDIGGGWGAPAPPSKPTPTVAADEDFGGWTSAAPVTSGTTTTSSTKPAGGFGGSDDLFSNVWE